MFKDVIRDHNVDLGDLSHLNLVVRDKPYFTEFGHILDQTNIEIIGQF